MKTELWKTVVVAGLALGVVITSAYYHAAHQITMPSPAAASASGAAHIQAVIDQILEGVEYDPTPLTLYEALSGLRARSIQVG
jgi:hypothetical protein